MHSLPALPYGMSALEPHLSAETLEYHWGKHHRDYVDTLNRLIADTLLAQLDLPELVRQSSGAVLNLAGQHFNHSFYWKSLTPRGGGEPRGELSAAIDRAYGSFAAFRTAFAERAASHFGSGWAWVVRKPDNVVRIELTHDAGCPIRSGDVPLLACDLWEHAYYIDYRNLRARYIEAFWSLADWRHAARIFDALQAGAPVSAAVPPVMVP